MYARERNRCSRAPFNLVGWFERKRFSKRCFRYKISLDGCVGVCHLPSMRRDSQIGIFSFSMPSFGWSPSGIFTATHARELFLITSSPLHSHFPRHPLSRCPLGYSSIPLPVEKLALFPIPPCCGPFGWVADPDPE